MPKFLFIAYLALCSVFLTTQAVACLPAPDARAASMAEKVKTAEFVFTGVVTAVEADTVTVAVQQYFKGEGAERVKIKAFNTHSCHDVLALEERRVFFAQGNPAKVLEAVYDGAFGSSREVTDSVLREIEQTQASSDMLEQDCTAVFDGASLHVPCVKVLGVSEIYEAKLEVAPMLPNRPMRFDLANAQPRPTPQSPEDNNGGIAPFYAAVQNVSIEMMESFPVQVNAKIDGYLRNGCEKLNPYTQALIKPDKQGRFFITLTVNPPVADVACITVIEDFTVNMPLDVLGLAAGNYTVIVNKEHKASFELMQDNLLPK